MATIPGSGNKKPNQQPNQQPNAKPVVKAANPILSSAAVRARTALNKEAVEKAPAAFIFGKKNYQFMLMGIAFIVIGFYLMSGTTDIMSTTKIVVAPIIVLTGFAIEFYAILTKPAKTV